MNKANVGEMITVKGIEYKIVLSEEPGANAKKENPSVLAWLGLQRPKGRKAFGAWQFSDGRIEICCAV